MDGTALPPDYRARSRDQLRQVQMIYQSADTALNPKLSLREIIGRPAQMYLGLQGAALDADLSRKRISDPARGTRRRHFRHAIDAPWRVQHLRDRRVGIAMDHPGAAFLADHLHRFGPSRFSLRRRRDRRRHDRRIMLVGRGQTISPPCPCRRVTRPTGCCRSRLAAPFPVPVGRNQNRPASALPDGKLVGLFTDS